jgi:DNA-binding response OmpR family regulator
LSEDAKRDEPSGEVRPVLVVDDDPAAVDIICRLLALEQIQTRRATGGTEALQAAQSEPIDLILLDVMMPGMDGIEVCRKLLADEHTRTIPIILLTGRDDHQTRAAGMTLGVSEFLTKPVNKRELYVRVHAQLKNRALARRMDRVIEGH